MFELFVTLLSVTRWKLCPFIIVIVDARVGESAVLREKHQSYKDTKEILKNFPR